jgi:hypothetical protein
VVALIASATSFSLWVNGTRAIEPTPFPTLRNLASVSTLLGARRDIEGYTGAVMDLLTGNPLLFSSLLKTWQRSDTRSYLVSTGT